MIVIIDYGVGNLSSIKNMLKKIGYNDVIISNREEDIIKAKKYILPGVGNFEYGMLKLKESRLIPILEREVLNIKKPILGICLGAQLLTNHSEEGDINGLGWLNAETVRFDMSKFKDNEKIPHMGWTEVKNENDCLLFADMYDDPRFYFVHSYHMKTKNKSIISVTANYGYDFAAGLQKDNILAMQFHPEKSHKFGMKMLENFIKHF